VTKKEEDKETSTNFNVKKEESPITASELITEDFTVKEIEGRLIPLRPRF